MGKREKEDTRTRWSFQFHLADLFRIAFQLKITGGGKCHNNPLTILTCQGPPQFKPCVVLYFSACQRVLSEASSSPVLCRTLTMHQIKCSLLYSLFALDPRVLLLVQTPFFHQNWSKASLLRSVNVQISKCICPTCLQYLSKLIIIFVFAIACSNFFLPPELEQSLSAQISQCSNFKMYLSNLLYCICPNL